MPEKNQLARLQPIISSLLNNTLDAKVQMHAVLTTQEGNDPAVTILSFKKGYNQAIRAIYDIIVCMNGLEGGKGYALEKSLEKYLETKK